MPQNRMIVEISVENFLSLLFSDKRLLVLGGAFVLLAGIGYHFLITDENIAHSEVSTETANTGSKPVTIFSPKPCDQPNQSPASPVSHDTTDKTEAHFTNRFSKSATQQSFVNLDEDGRKTPGTHLDPLDPNMVIIEHRP